MMPTSKEELELNKQKKMWTGKVISDKMQKTVTVEVERTFMHSHCHKIVRKRKKYNVHDEQQQAHVGDIVTFYEGRPISKTKYMYLAEVLQPNTTSKAG
jgi:small subunit ribosomal protein S17